MLSNRSTYLPFRINSKDYFIQKKLGADGYFASAFLAATDNSLSDSLVIKVLHPHILYSAIADRDSAIKSKSMELVAEFASEVILLSFLEKDGVEAAVKLRGIPRTLADLIEDQEKKVEIRRLSLGLPAEPYKHFPDFVPDYFDGEATERQKLDSCAEDLKRWLATTGIGIPYLAMEFVSEPYQNLVELLTKKEFDLMDKLTLCRRYVEVLKNIHSRDIVYQDLKENHIFWDLKNKRIKVIDWNASKPGGTDQQKQEDLYIFGKLAFRIFTGSAYINPNSVQRRLGSRLEIITLANLAVASGSATSIDFGTGENRLSPGLRIIIEKLLWPSADGRYHNVSELEADLSSKALDEWSAAGELNFEFISKMGLKADGKQALGLSALRAHDYSDAQGFFRESEFYAASIHTAVLLLETRFRQKEDETAVSKLKPIQLMLEQNDYDAALQSIQFSGLRELMDLAFVVKELQDALSNARTRASKGGFDEVQDLYLDALLIDYQCEEAREEWEKLNSAISLLNKIEQANQDGRPEQAEILIGEFKNQFGDAAAIQKIGKLIDYRKYYQRAQINKRNDRFVNALEELEQALRFSETQEAIELQSKIKTAISSQAEINRLIANTKYKDADGDYEEAKRKTAELLKKEYFPESHLIKNLYDQISSRQSIYKTIKDLLENAISLRKQVNFEKSRDALTGAQKKVLEFPDPSEGIVGDIKRRILSEIKEVETTQKDYESVLREMDSGNYDDVLSRIVGLKGRVDDALLRDIQNGAEGAKTQYEKTLGALSEGKYELALQTLQEYLSFDSHSDKSKELAKQVNSEASLFFDARDELNRARGLAGSGQWADAISTLVDLGRMVDQINENPAVRDLKKKVRSDYSANKSALSNFEQADKYLREGNFSGAIIAIDTVLKSFPFAESVLLIKQSISAEQELVEKTQKILKEFALARAEGNLKVASVLVGELKPDPASAFARKLYEDEQIEPWRQKLAEIRKCLDEAEKHRDAGRYDEGIASTDRAIQVWMDCRIAQELRKELVNRKASSEKLNNLLLELEKIRQDGDYSRAIYQTRLYLKENPNDEKMQARLDDLIQEGKSVKNILAQLEKLRSKYTKRVSDLLLTDAENLRSLAEPLRKKASESDIYLNNLMDQIDKFDDQLIEKLEGKAEQKCVGKDRDYSESLEIYEKIIKYRPTWLEDTSGANKDRLEKLRKQQIKLTNLKTVIESLDLKQADAIISAIPLREDSRLSEYKQLLRLCNRIIEDLNSSNFEDIGSISGEEISHYDAYITPANLSLIVKECRSIVNGDVKELSGVVERLNALVAKLGQRDQFLKDNLQVLLSSAYLLLSVTQPVEQLVEREDFLGAENCLNGISYKSLRLQDLRQVVTRAKAGLYAKYKAEGEQALKEGRYDIALTSIAYAWKYANSPQYQELDRIRNTIIGTRENILSQRQNEADDLIRAAKNKYEKFVEEWRKNFVGFVDDQKRMPVLDSNDEFFKDIESDILRCRTLDALNQDAGALQKKIDDTRRMFNELNNINSAIQSGNYSDALQMAENIPLSRYISMVVDEQKKLNREFDKIFGGICKDWEHLRYKDLIEKAEASLTRFPTGSEHHQTIMLIIEIAKTGQQLMQEANKALDVRQLELAQNPYRALLKHIEDSIGHFDNKNYVNYAGYKLIQAKLKKITEEMEMREKRIREVDKALQNSHYRDAHKRFMYFTDNNYPPSEKIDQFQTELIQKADELMVQGESQKGINNAKSLHAYGDALLLIEGIDTERMRKAADERDKVRLIVTKNRWRSFRRVGSVAVIVLAGIAMLLYFRLPLNRLLSVLTSSAPATEPVSVIITSTNTNTPLHSITPTIIATNTLLPVPIWPGVGASPIQDIYYFPSIDDLVHDTLRSTLSAGTPMGICNYDSEHKAFQFVFEGKNCLKTSFWINRFVNTKEAVEITAIYTPQQGVITAAAWVYTKLDKSDHITVSNTSYQVCSIEKNLYAITNPEGDCQHPNRWVDPGYISITFYQSAVAPINLTPTFTVEPISTSTPTP